MANKLIIGNWKMNPATLKEAKATLAGIKKELKTLRRTKIIICPPMVYLGELKKVARGGMISLGAQDVHEQDQGPYTGGVSAFMVRDLGVMTTIIGHSERRAAGDTDISINLKITRALSAGLAVILCVGETERDNRGEYLSVLQDQLTKDLNNLPSVAATRLVVAYEPVWAIGRAASGVETPDGFLHNKIFIRKTLAGLLGRKKAVAIPVLYGGSVNALNAADFLMAGQADGLLVGRDSLNPKNFATIVKLAEKA